MKFLALLVMLASASTFAAEYGVCDYIDSTDFVDAKTVISTADRPSRFSAFEKKLVKEASELVGKSLKNGFISYYNVNGKMIALVSSLIDEEHYGAFFEVKASSSKLIATIENDSIVCN